MKDKIKTYEIKNPPKSWWAGDKRVEPYMPKVDEAIRRHIPNGCTDIYNRCYEAIYQAILDYSKENTQ